MTLLEMSFTYQSSACAIRRRIAELQLRERKQPDSEEAARLRRRIDDLKPLLREARELASLTAHYYDRSTYKYEQCKL